MIKIAEITLPDTSIVYAEFSTVTDSCSCNVFSDKELGKRFSLDDVVGFGNIKVINSEEKWPVYFNNNACMPFSDGGEEEALIEFEGVVESGTPSIIHLRKAGGQGMAICEHEFTKIMSKYVFSEGNTYLSQFNNHEYRDVSLVALTNDGEICLNCFRTEELKRKIT